jgi:hypothetical protein
MRRERAVAPYQLAGGRDLPPLLFITCSAALTGFGETLATLQEAIPAPHRIVVLPDDGDPEALAGIISDAARNGDAPAGVVLLGGYDTLPARLVRAIGDDLLPDVSMQEEIDHYIAWNDDHYGDLDGNGLPEVPVSRIPAGVNLRRALHASAPADAPARPPWRAVRIDTFDYADSVYQGLKQAGTCPMLNFGPATAHLIKQDGIAAERVYFACHADYSSPAIFKTFQGIPVVKARQVPDADGSIVLAACCYSATTVNVSPLHASTAGLQRPAHLRADQSLALTYIDKGARAYVGFTALLWIPKSSPFGYFGAPLHRMFWENVTGKGIPPARALFEAKAEFILNTPYASPEGAGNSAAVATSTAKHLKDYWAATCLGLGW